jgi:uncharacterized membrane protein (UPF0127 family)
VERQSLVIARTGEAVATDLEVARSHWQRMRGLLGRDGLPPGGGIRFDGTNSIHMAFMKFPIDVLYLDRAGRVVKMVHHLRPWRFSASRRAKVTIELPAGTLQSLDIRPGDEIEARSLVAS